MPTDSVDNEFYVVVWTDEEYKVPNHVFVHLRNGETIFDYMLRVHKVSPEEIEQIYKRTYAK